MLFIVLGVNIVKGEIVKMANETINFDCSMRRWEWETLTTLPYPATEPVEATFAEFQQALVEFIINDLAQP